MMFFLLLATSSGVAVAQRQTGKIVHDAEYYILEAQNGKRWAAEDKSLGAKLAELRKKHGRPPNIIHIMWDDTAFGDVGIPAIQQVRGLRTPNPFVIPHSAFPPPHLPRRNV